MSHEVRVTVRSWRHHRECGSSYGHFLNNMTVENCSGSVSGVTDAQGMNICRLTSQLPNEFIFDVQAKSAEEEGWVLLYDTSYFFTLPKCTHIFYSGNYGPGSPPVSVVTTNTDSPESGLGLTTSNHAKPFMALQGKIEGETGFIETNLAQLSELVDSYGTTGVFRARLR